MTLAFLSFVRTRRSVSYVQQLRDTFGTQWEYDGVCGWWETGTTRHVQRTCGSMFEEDNAPADYWLYGSGKPPQLVHWGVEGLGLKL